MWVFVCTVLTVKSFSGCYPSCPNCRRKLKELKVERYWCRRCQLECLHEEVVHRYCVGLTATNHTIYADVVVFGSSLDSIFGGSASEFHRWSVGLQSSRDLDFEETFSYLLQRSLETVFVGKCFAFTFQHPIPLENHSKHSLSHYGSSRLIATSVKPLGSISHSIDVITLLKYHFNENKPDLRFFGEAPPSNIVHSKSTTSNQSVVIPCCNTYTTVSSSQGNSTSFLYESMRVSESHVSHKIQFESYCDPSTDCSLSTPSSRALSHADILQTPSGGVAIKTVSQAPSALSVSAGLLCTHMDVTTPECNEHSIVSSEAVDLEILQELISDWECSQNVQENSTTSSDADNLLSGPDLHSISYDTRPEEDPKRDLDGCHSLDQQSDISLSNFSEAIIAELQSSFNRSVYPTPCGSVGKHKGCSSLNSSATAYAPLTSLRSTPYDSPELFSSASSLAPAAVSTNRKLTSKQPPLSPWTWVSPEMFDSSAISLQTTPFQGPSHSYHDSSGLPEHYFTPAVDRHSLSLPRRKILTTSGSNTQQEVMIEPASKPYLLDSPSMKNHVESYTTPSGQSVENNHFVTFSPDLFSQT